jgi:galactokinase
MRRCWDQDASKRPDFDEVVKELDRIGESLGEEKDDRPIGQRMCSACFGGGGTDP